MVLGKQQQQQQKKKLEILEHLYKDVHSPASYTSVEPLLREARKRDASIKRTDVEDFLSTQRTYTIHRQAVRRYKKLRTLASGLHTDWQADLSVFDKLSAQNRGFKYLLVCIDTLSRQLFVEPVKSKQSEHMIDGFERVFKRSVYMPWKLVTDQGLEFTARRVQTYFQEKGIKHFCMYTSPQFHAAMAERANRTIKERLYRYFTERKTQNWISVIQHIVSAINHSHNSAIGMRPVDVTFDNAEQLRKMLAKQAKSENKGERRKKRFRVGDTVRIEKYKHIFQKGYTGRFTDEIFTVAQVLEDRFPVTYRLQDASGEEIKGRFYANDLSLVKEPPEGTTEQLTDIQKVLRHRKRDGVEYMLVKWKGYPASHNSWIPVSSVHHK